MKALRFFHLSIVLLVLVGCSETPQDESSPASASVGDSFALMLKLSDALKSNDWETLYDLHSEAFHNAVGRDTYLEIIERSGLEIFDVRNRKSTRDDAHGYVVIDVDFMTRAASRRWEAEVIFVSKDGENWRILNFPIESVSGLNFGVVPKFTEYPNASVETSPVSGQH